MCAYVCALSSDTDRLNSSVPTLAHAGTAPALWDTHLICSMSCRRAKLTFTASEWTQSRQNGQQNTDSCRLGCPAERRLLKHGRQNVCPHGVDTGTRVSLSSSRKQIGHSQAVRSSIFFLLYADTTTAESLMKAFVVRPTLLLCFWPASLACVTYATFCVLHHSRLCSFHKRRRMTNAASEVKSLSVSLTSSPDHDPTLRRLRECCVSLHSSCSKWRKLNSDALDHATVMVNATIKLRSQYVT